jgi:hypothetical protein
VALCALAFVIVGAYSGRVCGHNIAQHPMTKFFTKRPEEAVIEVSQHLQGCMPGTFGLAGAFVTIALVHASLFWKKSSWLGWQHVLALRWLGAIAVLCHMYLHKRLVYGPQLGVSQRDEAEAFAAIVQVVLVALVFLPKFARHQPIAFFFLINALGAMLGLTSGVIPLAAEPAHRLAEGMGLLSAFASFVAVFLSGGIGIAFTLFVVGLALQVHMPWMLNL